MDKQQLSERDICTQYVTPALVRSGWELATQVREEFSLTNGRILVRGKLHARARNKRADYVLFYKSNLPIAVIEAKDNRHSLGDGMQQGLGYGELLQVPFIFSSNGDGFLFHNKIAVDGVIEREIGLDEFPSAETLWQWWAAHRGLSEAQQNLVKQDYYSDGSDKTPRYYQLLAIDKTMEAIARGQNRILLVMATGTGKTFTAFQIIWRLWKSKTKQRILFLADRNILVDQTMTNDFKSFGSAMTKIQKRQADKSYEIYLSLYQALPMPEIVELGLRLRVIVWLAKPVAVDSLRMVSESGLEPGLKSWPEAGTESRLESRLKSRLKSPLAVKVLLHLVQGDDGKAGIARMLGHKTVSGELHKQVKRLLELNLIEYTIPDKPNSRLQKYRLTPLGKSLLATEGNRHES